MSASSIKTSVRMIWVILPAKYVMGEAVAPTSMYVYVLNVWAAEPLVALPTLTPLT
jgi:hypothetical protein